MKLYTFEPAPNPMRLDLFLKYKGVSLDTTQVNLMKAEHLRDEYRAIVPAMTVPALVLEDGVILTEVIGICAFLEETFPQKPLMGTTALERAQVISWDHRLYLDLLGAIAETFRNANPVFANRALPGPVPIEQIPALAERGRFRLGEMWKAMDAVLADREWLVGDSLTFADIDMVACESFSGWIEAQPDPALANLQAYLSRAKAELGLAAA
ncbi:glutathione S-transferase family protein [Haliea sp. E17]|uniref:glutathione S-transferase family protein n=1 Tax=Haliea sp. E17 TaxID=3401576 RepID=UPI003AAA973C